MNLFNSRELWFNEGEAAAEIIASETESSFSESSEALRVLESKGFVVVKCNVKKDESTLTQRLTIPLYIMIQVVLLITLMPLKYVVTGDYYFDRRKGLGRYVFKILDLWKF